MPSAFSAEDRALCKAIELSARPLNLSDALCVSRCTEPAAGPVSSNNALCEAIEAQAEIEPSARPLKLSDVSELKLK